MPKIRDLAINAFPSNHGAVLSHVKPPPSPPKPGCKPSPKPKPYTAHGVPADAVMRMKQQLQQRTRTHDQL